MSLVIRRSGGSGGPGQGDPREHGQYYWCVKKLLSEDGEIYVNADDARILPDGSLVLVRHKEDGGDRCVNLALAPAQRTCVFMASLLDGSAVAVDHWKGEIEAVDC